MAEAVTATVDAAQLARTQRMIDELQSVLGRDAFQALTYAAVAIGRSGAARSKPGIKRRPLERNAFFGMAGHPQAGRRWMVQVMRQPPGKPWLWFTNDKDDRMRQVPRHGLQRRIWRRFMGIAGSTKDGTVASVAEWGRHYGRFIANRGKDDASITMKNLTKYFTDAYGEGALTEIYNAATRAMNYKINEKLGVTVDRGNRP